MRLLRHSFQIQFLLLGLTEFMLLTACVYVGYWLRIGSFEVTPAGQSLPVSSIVFAIIMVLSNVAMGVYTASMREGFTGMILRTAVGYFLIGTVALSIIFFAFPDIILGRGVFALATVAAFLSVTVLRWFSVRLIDDERLKKRILVLGAGRAAQRLATRLRRRSDQRGFTVIGYAPLESDMEIASTEVDVQMPILPTDERELSAYCIEHDVAEIVVAVDERRRRSPEQTSGLPLDALLQCRLSGIPIREIPEFFERELGKVELDFLTPSWMVFSDGFSRNIYKEASQRVFDILAALMLLAVTWPVMLFAALLVWLESAGKDPVFYLQERVGLDGRIFRLIKFRSMRTDAEQNGEAVWAQKQDPRVTRIGALLRNTRIDELPQIFNVIRGEMSFVGPRPERPQFVEQLKEQIPYYDARHKIKPGITGWAQLCYPYGASVEDARQKLQYDLYYLKNHSLLLDLIVLIQTVEVVLIGDGAR